MIHSAYKLKILCFWDSSLLKRVTHQGIIEKGSKNQLSMNLGLPEQMVRDLRRMQDFHAAMRDFRIFMRRVRRGAIPELAQNRALLFVEDEACELAELVWLERCGYWRRVLDRGTIESEIVRITLMEIRDLKRIIRADFPEFAQHSNLLRDYRGGLLGP